MTACKQMQFNATLNYLPQATYTRIFAYPGAVAATAVTGAVIAEAAASQMRLMRRKKTFRIVHKPKIQLQTTN